MSFARVTLESLRIEDERSLRSVALYPRLKAVLVRDGYRFRVSRTRGAVDWNRAVFLNLSFWSPRDSADVIVDGRLPADVVAHVAWHHVARRALGAAASTVDGMLLGESIASAFDVYLVGRLLRDAPRASFLRMQVEAMSEAWGSSRAAFGALLADIGRDPAAAFAELRRLLFDAATSLARARGLDDAAARLDHLAERCFFPLLHHYNLSNWLLHGRAYAPPATKRIDARVAAADRALRREPVELDWLERRWLRAVEAKQRVRTR